MIGCAVDPDLQWFANRVAGISQRMTDLEQRTREGDVHDELLLLDLVEELRTAFKELQAANEELRTQAEELQAAHTMVEHERRQYGDLFLMSPDPYLVTDALGVIQMANVEAATLLGLPSEMLCGRPLALHVAPAAQRAFRAELSVLRSAMNVQRFTLRIVGQDGAEHELSARIRAVLRPDAEVKLCWALRDVGTEREDAQWQALGAELTGGEDPDRLDHATALVETIGGWWHEMTGAVVLIPDNDGTLRMIAPPEGRLESLERLQMRMGEGPALDAYRTGQVVDAPDLASDPRYPRFGPAAATAGITSVLACPLGYRHDQGPGDDAEPGAIGVLVLADKQPGEISEQLLRGAGLFAEVTRTLLRQAREAAAATQLAAHLQTALDSRIIIEQAKGKLGERLGCTPDEAFPLMRRYARSHNMRLHDFASELLLDKIDVGSAMR
jgi:PAS domain S-box-containing protein